MARTLGETDLIHNGQNAWLWDSSTQKVTHYVPAASSSPDSGTAPERHATGDAALTPDGLAQQILAHLTPSTTVTVNPAVDVAGRGAYVLSLAPKAGTAGAATSTVQQITVAVDSATGLPVQVQVFAKASTSPALSVGFSSLDFSLPSTSEFAAPHGVTTETKVVGHSHAQASASPSAAPSGAAPSGAEPSSSSSAAVGIGTDWGKVYTVSQSSLGSTGRSASQLDAVTTVVTGKFGTARLLTTTLVNALIFPDGHVVIGAVTPAALEAAAAQG
jgi:outer membrane lipoprotein-sorting protein